MSERRRGWDRGERTFGESNGYAEIDPTGRYGHFDEVLGKGAMKTVYKAFDSVNGTEVAWNQARLCSVLQSPHELQRLYSEVHLLNSLHHECIIKYHASWIDVDKRTFNFITEMFTSGTLREYRLRYPRVDIRAIKSWARQILHGLVYLHGHDPPVIHRDIKCDNIFINGHLGQVKIGDFGLAAVLRGSESAHSVIGTPEFMAPELYEEEYNELVDVYSFGLCVLEMLTCEYPYSECFNPAQIYKKVTSGKLPDAFYRIQDPESQQFISRCLGNMSNRLSAKELLLDPFLTLDDHNVGSLLTLKTIPVHGVQKIRLQDHDHSHLLDVCGPSGRESMIDMTITGKRNVEDDTIFLKVQIFDKEGHAKNIYFPFDIASDTPIDVANEMVKELEITDREPSEIAEMIAQEVSLLVPDWKTNGPNNDLHHVYNYKDDPEDGCNHPFYNDLSSPTSSQGSVFCQHHHHQGEWLQDELSSTYSAKSSVVNYTSNQDQERKMSIHHPTQYGSLANEFHKQCKTLPDPPSRISCVKEGKKTAKGRRLTRNWSLVDVRSHLLHRNLLELLKKRLFKTVGAVENVGFQKLCGGSRKPLMRTLSSSGRDCRKLKQVHEQGEEDLNFREHI